MQRDEAFMSLLGLILSCVTTGYATRKQLSAQKHRFSNRSWASEGPVLISRQNFIKILKDFLNNSPKVVSRRRKFLEYSESSEL